MRPGSLVAVAAVVGFCLPSFGQQRAARDPNVEQGIRDRLAAIAPQAVDGFQRATAALDAEDYRAAIPLYQQVLEEAPLFTPAMRRLGASLAATGQTRPGLDYCEKAVKLERSPENLVSLGQMLAYPAPNQQGSEVQMQRAFSLAKEAVEKDKREEDGSYLSLLASLALTTEHEADFRQASETLARTHPEIMSTHYFNAIRLAMDQNWIDTEDEIKTAERLGLPHQTAEALRSSSGIRRRAMIARGWRYAPWVIGMWVLALLLLYAVGKIFSSLTLRFIESADPNASISGKEAFLRTCYRQLINVAGYVSLPIVFVLVLGLAQAE
jgi:tetratricopeptide (TPR) repeat protein